MTGESPESGASQEECVTYNAANDNGFVSEPVLRTLVYLTVVRHLEVAAKSALGRDAQEQLAELLPGASNEIPRIIDAVREEFKRLEAGALSRYLQWSREAQRSPKLSYARSRARAKNESVVPPAVLPPPGFAQPVAWQNPFEGCICHVFEYRYDCPACRCIPGRA